MEADYRLILAGAFEARKQRNPRYSLRGFSKFLQIDPSFMSKLMTEKILLSLDTADQISDRLKLKKNERDKFLLSAAEEQKCHALYLIDPSLTDCDPDLDSKNKLPLRR